MSERIEEIAKKFNVNLNELKSWAAQNYPQWQTNLRLMMALYLKYVRKLEVSPEELDLGAALSPSVKISDLEVGQWETIQAFVASKLNENAYMGCGECFKKLDDGICPAHGKVEPMELMWRRYIAADDTGHTILSMPPKFRDLHLEDHEVVIRGVLNERLEFFVNNIKILKKVIPSQQIVNSEPNTVTSRSQQSTIPARPSEEDLEAFKGIMSVFRMMNIDELQSWKAQNNVQSSLDALIAMTNCKREGNNVIFPEVQ